MPDPELVELARPLLQLRVRPDGEADVVQAGAALVEPVAGLLAEVGVQPEQHAAVQREDGVVELAALLVLDQDGIRAEQLRVPVGAAPDVGHGDGDVLETGEGHGRAPLLLRAPAPRHRCGYRCLSISPPKSRDPSDRAGHGPGISG